jgi:hypothetical protein
VISCRLNSSRKANALAHIVSRLPSAGRLRSLAPKLMLVRAREGLGIEQVDEIAQHDTLVVSMRLC